MESIKNYWNSQSTGVKIALVVFVVVSMFALLYGYFSKSPFTGTLSAPISSLTNSQPMSFPPLTQKSNQFLKDPVVPEEIGFSQVYPQGVGVSMDRADSNAFTPDKPGPLLTEYSIPESYGASSLADRTGTKGVQRSARVIRCTDSGNQLLYKPLDEADSCVYASAYSDGEVTSGMSFMENVKKLDYNDTFSPENNLMIQTSPGQEGTLPICEKTYPNVVKYGDFCITAGDIPYGQVVDGKVNPRLVSRWESYTGDYSRKDALEPIDGLLYPKLNVM